MSRPFRSRPPALGVVIAAAAVLPALLFLGGASSAGTPDKGRVDLEQRFAKQVKPFLNAYCVSCHGKDKPQAQLDLSAYTSMSAAAADYPHLALLVDKLAAKQMPPQGSKQPPAAQ